MAQTKYKLVITALNKTQAAFASVKKGVGNVANAAKKVGKVLGGVLLGVTAVATAFAAMGKKAFDALDEIGKTADRTGIAAEKLQALRLGAVESGASVEDLNKAMEKFAKNIGDVLVKGTGEATYALDKMGIKLRDNSGRLKSTDTLLTEVVAGIGELGSESERTSTLMALFGKPGLKLNWVLGKGAEAMEAWTTKAKEMGIIVDARAIKAVENFNDRFTELKFISDAFIKQTFAALAPGLEKMITHFTNWRIETNKVNGGLEELGTTIAEDVVEGLASMIEGFGEAIVFLQETNLWLKRTKDRLKAVSGWNPYPKKEFARIEAQYKEDLKNLDKFSKKTQDAADKLRGFFKKTEEAEGGLKKLNEDGAKPFIESVDVMARSFEAFGVGFSKVTEDGSNQFKQMEKVGEKVAKTLEDGLVNAFMNIGKGADSLRNLMDNILKQIIAQLIRVHIVQAAVTKIETFFGFKGKAMGGPVAGGQSYIVGEKGPEIFTPGQSGHITPNNQLGAGTNVNVSFNITAFDSQSATSAIAEQAPTIVGIVEQSFRKRGHRGPLGG
jgi:ribosomal protein L22